MPHAGNGASRPGLWVGARQTTLGYLAIAIAVAACGPPADDSNAPADPSRAIVRRLGLHGEPVPAAARRPDFVLTDTEGRSFDFRRDTEGRLTLLFFGYTNCPDICPVHLANLSAVLDMAPPDLRSQVRVVFVGVDAGRDTPERVREWLSHFDPSFVGLTGTQEQLDAAQVAAGVPPAFVDDEWEGGYSVGHAAWIALFTADDRAQLRYPFGIRQSEWAHDLEILVERGWPDA